MNRLLGISNFGAIDAESDGRLLDCFYRASIIDDLLNYSRSIVIGRKGSGKTAIYKYLQNTRGTNCIPLLFREYPWSTHDAFRNNIVSERESYINSWTFFFYIEILKKLVSQQCLCKNKETKSDIRKLEKWLKKNWGSSAFDFKETLTPQRKKFNFTFSPQIFGNSLGSLSRDVATSINLGATLTEYNKKIESIISRLAQHLEQEDILLMFDELDLAYSQNDEAYTNRLIGLLIAAYNIHDKFNQKIKVLLFLRNDIFNQLQFQDKNKIKDNLVVFLNWSDETDSVLNLKSLVSSRIKEICETGTDDFATNWDALFIEGKIGNNKLKWSFLLERTFKRPRDAIKFLNLALEAAKERIRREELPDKITNDDIHSIRSSYSTYLYEELRDEITGKYPDFDNYMELLRDVHTLTFSRESFVEHYNTLRQRLHLEIDVDTILTRLYEFSIIGFYKPGGGGFGGSEYRFQYASDYQAFNSGAQKFRVHAGFIEYLELKERNS